MRAFALVINAAAVMLGAASLRAAEVCVSCEEPAATYRCSVEKSERLAEFGVEKRAVARACPALLRKSHGHRACTVVPAEGDACKGEAATLGLDDLRKVLASNDAEPTYVPSLTERVGGAVASAGEAVAGAVKKSWDCVSSLLMRCN